MLVGKVRLRGRFNGGVCFGSRLELIDCNCILNVGNEMLCSNEHPQ